MNPYMIFTVLAFVLAAEASKSHRTPPKVQVYSHNPGEFDEENVLICLVSEFHPPDISISLMHNGLELPSARQTDLAFHGDWHFYLTRSAVFTPRKDDKFLCRVNHGGRIMDYQWEPGM